MIISFYDDNGIFYKTIESASVENITMQIQEGDKFVEGNYRRRTHFIDDFGEVKEFSAHDKEMVENEPFGHMWCGRKKDFIRALDEQRINDYHASEVRGVRNFLLESSDALMGTSDLPLSEEEKTSIREYRQYLRDLPTTDGFPLNADFKAPPCFDKFSNKDSCLNFLNAYDRTKEKINIKTTLKTKLTELDRLK